MTWSRILVLVFVLVFSVVPCFAHHMAVVVNKENSVAEVTSAHLAKLVRLETRKWTNGRDVVLVLHKDSAGEAATLARLSHMSHHELQALIASHRDAFILVDSDADALRAVEKTPGALGFVEVHSINDQVNVVKVGGKLPMEEGYLPH